LRQSQNAVCNCLLSVLIFLFFSGVLFVTRLLKIRLLPRIHVTEEKAKKKNNRPVRHSKITLDLND
jgi:hypothetical protein